MKKENQSKIMLICAMLIFGTIGLFRKYIPLPSGMLAMARGFIGMFFLIFIIIIKREKLSFEQIKKNFVLLFLSGAFIGFNWILLFEAYRYTSVAVATLCYYMAPMFVVCASPFIFGERLNSTKIICILAAFVGMIMISGVLNEGSINSNEIKGVLFGLGAALLYATVIMMNKKIGDIKAYDKTIVQLGTAGLVILPYTLLAEGGEIVFTPFIIFMIVVVGILHTGVAYALYFGAVGRLKAQTTAIFSYIDPVVAVILSTLILGEKIGIIGYIGAILILGAAFLIERPQKSDAK